MNFTQHVLGDYLDENKERQNWMRTFLKFERSLVGEETDQAMRLKIWNSVIFFNYLQVAMGGPREAGTSGQYQQAGKAFFEAIEKYQPEYIIVWGKRLWNNLPETTGNMRKHRVFTGRIAMTSKWTVPGCLMAFI